MKSPAKFDETMLAPCGMNCTVFRRIAAYRLLASPVSPKATSLSSRSRVMGWKRGLRPLSPQARYSSKISAIGRLLAASLKVGTGRKPRRISRSRASNKSACFCDCALFFVKVNNFQIPRCVTMIARHLGSMTGLPEVSSTGSFFPVCGSRFVFGVWNIAAIVALFVICLLPQASLAAKWH